MSALFALLGSLFGGLVSGIGRIISVETIKFLAWKAFYFTVLFIILPIVLYNVLTGIVFDFMSYALNFLDAQNIQSLSIQFTGMGAYIANLIKLPQCFSVFMSFLSIRFLMRFIPFFK